MLHLHLLALGGHLARLVAVSRHEEAEDVIRFSCHERCAPCTSAGVDGELLQMHDQVKIPFNSTLATMQGQFGHHGLMNKNKQQIRHSLSLPLSHSHMNTYSLSLSPSSPHKRLKSK